MRSRPLTTKEKLVRGLTMKFMAVKQKTTMATILFKPMAKIVTKMAALIVNKEFIHRIATLDSVMKVSRSKIKRRMANKRKTTLNCMR